MSEAALRQALSEVRGELAARHPVLVDTTSWRWASGRVVVEGGVLLAAQAEAYARGLAERLGVEVGRPAVLSALDSPPSLHRWVRLRGEDPLDLHRASDGEDLQTQWLPPAWLRRFAERDARALVQLPDGTLGWVEGARLEHGTPEGDPWADIARPMEGPVPVRAEVLAAAELARARLGRPYRWGGNTEAAADCSGFVQSVVLAAAGILLPKNTRDQRGFGARVAAADIVPGDLIFVRGKQSRLGHVGIALPALDGDGTTVAHSCLSRKRVLEEPLPDFLARYQFTAARRVVAWGEVER